MTNEPLLHWPDPIFELVGFVAYFVAVGAVGFRLTVSRGVRATTEEAERAFGRSADRRAALYGLIGILATTYLSCQALAERAAEQHTTLFALATARPINGFLLALDAVAALGLALAAFGVGFGWPVATIAIVLVPLRTVFFGQVSRVVNPLHELAGGLWIGTLFQMVVTGIVPALRSPLASDRRGALVQRMVNAFSPLALGSVALLATMGVITAWTHLKRLDALWTTPYGYALCVKLALVAGVLALGAWNWRRAKPRLGTEAGAIALRGSATGELLVASAVLVVTSILVSLPSPR